MLTVRGEVDELTGLDKASLALVPALQRAIEHDEGLGLTSMYVAWSHASQPTPLLDKWQRSLERLAGQSDNALACVFGAPRGNRTPNPLIKRKNGPSAVLTCKDAGRVRT
jgi:hypothetical protein